MRPCAVRVPATRSSLAASGMGRPRRGGGARPGGRGEQAPRVPRRVPVEAPACASGPEQITRPAGRPVAARGARCRSRTMHTAPRARKQTRHTRGVDTDSGAGRSIINHVMSGWEKLWICLVPHACGCWLGLARVGGSSCPFACAPAACCHFL
jgi:hypothetical protein